MESLAIISIVCQSLSFIFTSAQCCNNNFTISLCHLTLASPNALVQEFLVCIFTSAQCCNNSSIISLNHLGLELATINAVNQSSFCIFISALVMFFKNNFTFSIFHDLHISNNQ
ncbi:MAG: hypothetical protein WCG25_09250 [bacterium]